MGDSELAAVFILICLEMADQIDIDSFVKSV